jgi:hypothetical protein
MWALGYHQCRWSYYPEEKVRELARSFREHKIPCDSIYLDIDYMDGYRCFTWNKEYFPDPKKMIADLEKDGFKTMVIIDPGIKIDANYPIFKEAKITSAGAATITLWKGRCGRAAASFPILPIPRCGTGGATFTTTSPMWASMAYGAI